MLKTLFYTGLIATIGFGTYHWGYSRGSDDTRQQCEFIAGRQWSERVKGLEQATMNAMYEINRNFERDRDRTFDFGDAVRKTYVQEWMQGRKDEKR